MPACTMESWGNRTLLEYHAESNSSSSIKALRVIRIANLDVIFILTVVNHESAEINDSLQVALTKTDPKVTITTSDKPYMAGNVMLISVRVPINTSLDSFHIVVKVIQTKCDYFHLIAPALHTLIASINNNQTYSNNESSLHKFNEYLQNQILNMLCDNKIIPSLSVANDYLNIWNTNDYSKTTESYVKFAHSIYLKFTDMFSAFSAKACGEDTYLIPKMQEYLKRLIREVEQKSGQTYISTITLNPFSLQQLWEFNNKNDAPPKNRHRLSII